MSDDEDDTHPNIDTPSLFRWRHQARVERMEEQKKERAILTKETLEHRQKMAELTKKLQKVDTSQSKETQERLKATLDELKKQEEDFKKKEEELAKKERVGACTCMSGGNFPVSCYNTICWPLLSNQSFFKANCRLCDWCG